MRDLVAAKDAGALPVLVETGNGVKTREAIQAAEESTEVANLADVPVYRDLAAFVDWLLDPDSETER